MITSATTAGSPHLEHGSEHDGLTAEQTLHVPALAWSLWAWEQLRLELGEAAIYCLGPSSPPFLGQVALMHGALPVLQLGSNQAVVAKGVQALAADDTGSLISELRNHLRGSVGVAAIDLSGKAEVSDVLFEALPRSARLMLAGRGSPLTIDFYNNVHRKGLLLRTCAYEPAAALESTYVARAARLLARRPELLFGAGHSAK